MDKTTDKRVQTDEMSTSKINRRKLKEKSSGDKVRLMKLKRVVDIKVKDIYRRGEEVISVPKSFSRSYDIVGSSFKFLKKFEI